MTTFKKTITLLDEIGAAIWTKEATYRKMDAKMFEHYSQNPLGMSKVVKEHFGIPDDKNFSVSMWPEGELQGCVYLMAKPKKNN